MGMTINEVLNWVFVVIAVGFVIYMLKNKNTVYVGVRDRKNKIHKIPVYSTDSEKEVLRKVEEYMRKNQ